MERTSCNLQDTSLLSSESCHTFGSAELEEFTVVASNLPAGSENCCRRRVDPDMAILAATSPEIKALNLPITPSFPEDLIAHHDRLLQQGGNSGSTVSSMVSSCASSVNSDIHLMGSSSLNFSEHDDIQNCAKQKEVPICGTEATVEMLQGEEDLTQQFQGFGFYPPPQNRTNIVPDHDYINNKENIPPITSKSLGKMGSQEQFRKAFGRSYINRNISESHCNYQQMNGRHSNRTTAKLTLHKRRSFDSLPSPAEIGSTRLLLRGSSCGAIFSFSPDGDDASIDDRNPRFHPPLQTQRMRPKSLNLTTGFR